MMEFRRINVQEERDRLVAFRKDSLLVSFGTDEGLGAQEEYLKWLESQAKKFPDGFVAFIEEGRPIGQLELTIKDYQGERIGYVNLYYLIPEKRGLGYGKKLHDYAQDFFLKESVRQFHLRVSPSNTRARAFYRKLGMSEIGPELDGKVIRMKGNLSYIDR